VPGDRAFVFTDDGIPGYRVRTLRDFVTALAVAPRRSVAGHMLRRDFSRWFEDVFRDGALAARVEALEGMSVGENTEDLAEAIARVIRARYETGADDLIAAPVVAPA
jgi:hypothetical protein